MKRAELNIRRSLSLELFGKFGCGQLVGCNVQEDNARALELLERLGQQLAVQDSGGQAIQLYKGWDGLTTPKTLHTLLAAMEVGTAMAGIRYDGVLPKGKELIRIERSNTNLQTGSDHRAR